MHDEKIIETEKNKSNKTGLATATTTTTTSQLLNLEYNDEQEKVFFYRRLSVSFLPILRCVFFLLFLRYYFLLQIQIRFLVLLTFLIDRFFTAAIVADTAVLLSFSSSSSSSSCLYVCQTIFSSFFLHLYFKYLFYFQFWRMGEKWRKK